MIAISYNRIAILGVHAIIPLTATWYDFMNDPPRYECEEDPLDTYSSLHCFEVKRK